MVAITIVIGAIALYWSYRSDLLVIYYDSLGHLQVARRVLDSRTPGVVQLGTVWLPVPHLMLLPFVSIDVLWHTGLAGGAAGLVCFAITAAALFLSIRFITQHKAAPWLGLLVLWTNPNYLYLQTTPLTEPVLIMSMTTATYFLLRWSRNNHNVDLIIAGLLSALAVGSRYDGWFFAVIGGGIVLLTAYFRSHDRMRSEGITLAYAVIPVYAMFLWVFYNWMFFGDPLEFQRGQYSAQWQQQQIEKAGGLATKMNIGLSTITYSWAVIFDLGLLVVLLTLVAVALYLVSKRFHRDWLVPYLFLSAFPFNITSLWLGQSAINTPLSSPPGYYNVRYGVMVLPAAVVFIGYLADVLLRGFRFRLWPWIVSSALVLVLAAQLAVYVPNWPASIITVIDALAGSMDNLSHEPEPLAIYL